MALQHFLLKEQISNYINNSGLNIGDVYFIIKNIYLEIERMYEKQVQIEWNEHIEEESSSTQIELEE